MNWYLLSVRKSLLNFDMKLVFSAMASLSLTIITWLDVVYVLEKSIFLSLSAVTVIPAAPKSALPD